MNLATLYTRNKQGKIDYWQIWVERGIYANIIRTRYGLLDGASPIEECETVSVGKNLGRSNETTPYEQACLEATAKWRKKKDKGYSEEIPREKVNALGLPMPMLAKTYKPGSLDPQLPVWIQPKLDGHRCLAGWVNGEVKLWSRGGKFIDTLPHINQALAPVLPTDCTLDGELYIHGVPLQDLTSMIRKGSALVRYHVYDQVSTEGFAHRFNAITCYSTEVLKVPTTFAQAQDIAPFMDRWIRKGYEGIMVRLGEDAPYEGGYRSASLLKVKKFEEREYKVLDISESQRGVICIQCNGFTVVAPGTAEDKREVFEKKDRYIGKLVTIQCAKLTKSGIPFHPVALRFREDI